MKRIIRRAIEENRLIEIIYTSNTGNISQRVIKVLSLKNQLLKAYCYTKRQVRAFKLESILSARMLEKMR